MSTGIPSAVPHFLGYADRTCLCGKSLPFERTIFKIFRAFSFIFLSDFQAGQRSRILTSKGRTRVGISYSIPTCKRKHEPCGTPAASQLLPKVKCCKTKPSHATCVPIPTLRSDSHTIRRKKSEHQRRKFGATSAGTGSRTMVQQSRPTVLHRKLRLSLQSTHHANLHLNRFCTES